MAILEPSRWLEFGWEWEIFWFGWWEWEIGGYGRLEFGWEELESGAGSVGQMGVCSVLRVAAPPGGEKHLLAMQNRKREEHMFRIEGSNKFSFEGSNI